MRLFAAFLILAFLGACSPTIVPAGPTVSEPKLTSDSFITGDGTVLPMKSWVPTDMPGDKPKAVILALHGFNDYSNAFALPAPTLVAHGIAIYAYDQRGFGEGPAIGEWAGSKALADDAGTAARLLAARYPGVPLYLLGESMGGAVAMLAMTGAEPPPVAGVILVGPAVWARRRMNLLERSALWISSHVAPWYSLTGKGLDVWPSDNVPMLRALGKDPLIIKETRIGTLDGLVNLMDQAYAAAPLLTGPALILHGEHDQIVPADPTYDVMAAVADKPGVVCAVYPKGYHMLLRDLQADTVLADIVAWIDNPKSALPSGADQRAAAVLNQHHSAPIMASAGGAG